MRKEAPHCKRVKEKTIREQVYLERFEFIKRRNKGHC